MAIEKMLFLKIVGSIEDMHDTLRKLVLSEMLHFDQENTDAYDNHFIMHEYETYLAGTSVYTREDHTETKARCSRMEQLLEHLSKGLDISLSVDKESILDSQYCINEAMEDLDRINGLIGDHIDQIIQKKAEILNYESLKEKLLNIKYKDIDFRSISNLNYFDYEIGALTSTNRIRLRSNYENISAVVLNIGTIKNSVEDLYIIIFPKKFRDETEKLLKSLNWVRFEVPGEFTGTVSEIIEQLETKIEGLKKETDALYGLLESGKADTAAQLNRIYTAVMLEKKVMELENQVIYGESTYVLNAWIREKDFEKVKDLLRNEKKKIIVEEKKVSEMEGQVMPPTLFRNNRFFKPFETIIRLYGLPSYYEIDPTPFVAIAFCLMFGIMFGDIGQGLVYFIAGLVLLKKMPVAGQVLTRLGGSSIIFGFIYGSFFGLEHSELPWLPSLIGKPLDPKNIPMILIAGVVFGIVVMTISFMFGIINCLRRGNIENGIFGKNGAAGYVFFMGLIMSAAAVVGVIGLPVSVPLIAMLVSLILMLFKEPLSNLVSGKKPLIHGSFGSYLTESIFEGVETILSTLSNAISFIRVGAFALNHAGLFLAFLVMSEMTSNIVLKIIILILGNVLILTLEGLVVFIQGLRLEYYEMFSKYFQGDGVAFKPVKISN
jgi:V/A-type H+-transporting ATPase subunit I